MELLKKTPRIEVVDALRGFAVMAILLVHNLEHFIFPVYPESSPEWLSVLDAGVFNAIFSLFAGKSYAIFALLFGFTFYIHLCQMVSNGPCLCFDSHHLQNCTCNRNRMIPIIRLSVYPQ